jgi:hypothetical protein
MDINKLPPRFGGRVGIPVISQIVRATHRVALTLQEGNEEVRSYFSRLILAVLVKDPACIR